MNAERKIVHKKNRINVNTDIPEDYFRFLIGIPFYDDYIS